MQDPQTKWDAIYASAENQDSKACEVLVQNLHLLPDSGNALDYAAGLGANALQLAKLGLTTQAWDISSVAMDKLQHTVAELDLTITTVVRDVEKNPPEQQQFDVIVVANFLHRATFNNLIAALNPNGLLFYQTFIQEKVTPTGPNNLDFLLARNELLNLCIDMDVLVYREEGKQGDASRGWRNQAMIIARKR